MKSNGTKDKSTLRFSDRLMRNVERAIAFHPTTNTEGKRDATCAFIPEAQKFAEFWGDCEVVGIDNTRPMTKRRDQVLYRLESQLSSVDLIAFFCHGWRNGIQLGFRNSDIEELASSIGDATTDTPLVALYCCSVAEGGEDGEGSFADKLRDRLCEYGDIHCSVAGHYTVGHTTRNPHVRVFTGAGSEFGGTGGYRLVSNKSALWRAWKQALKTNFRFRFPVTTLAGVHQELIECYL